MNDKPFTIPFPEAKAVVVSGDIHGDFNQLVYKLCVQYSMTDTLLIVAGDCGFGFEKKDYYYSMAKRNDKRMSAANNWIVFVRGNHDNPEYFDGKVFHRKRFIAVPDYSVIQAAGHTILCVGGAISVDRSWRKERWTQITAHNHHLVSDEPLARNIYWRDENPVYNEELLDAMLLEDVTDERATIDKIYNKLYADNHPMTHWCYGHFHQSWHSSIDGVLFLMLDIMEFYEIP